MRQANKTARLIAFLLLWCLPPCLCFGQRVPSWMNELPTPGNDTYLYVRESGEGATVDEALNRALARVMQTTANRIGQPFDSQIVYNQLTSGEACEAISRQYNIPINKVDQYQQRLRDKRYRVYVLCQVALQGNVQPVWEELRRSGESNNWTALAKSAILPGLGQMGKGRVGSGVATLVGEVALAGAGVGSYLLAQEELSTMRNSTVSYDDFVSAQQRYNTLRSANRIAWGAAGVLYLYNLVRAFTIQPRGSATLSFEPSVMPSPSGSVPAMGLAYHF